MAFIGVVCGIAMVRVSCSFVCSSCFHLVSIIQRCMMCARFAYAPVVWLFFFRFLLSGRAGDEEEVGGGGVDQDDTFKF